MRTFTALLLAGFVVIGVNARVAAQSIDLLRSVTTDVAVSSVYRGQEAQLGRLTDGDPESAWNSRSRDLVGAWIEARLPENVSVTSIEMTVGFTKADAERDLFTGNHRIRRVRVLRNGTAIGEFNLDPESRALQSIPIESGGGVFRVEILETQPGTRTDWREVCISEFRIMGRAPDARAGERTPRFAVGELPAPRPTVGTANRDEVARLFATRIQHFDGAWRQMERDFEAVGGTPEDWADLADTRRSIAIHTLEVVELVDDVLADRLRTAARTDPTDLFATVVAGFEVVARWLADSASLCEVETRHTHIILRRADAEVQAVMDDFDGPYPNERQAANLRRATTEWLSNTRQGIVDLGDLNHGLFSDTSPHRLTFAALLRARVEQTRRVCGF